MATVRARCPTCDGERMCSLHGSVEKKWDWEDKEHRYSMNGGSEHSLLECLGCEAVFYQKVSWDSEDIDQWYGPNGETLGDYVRRVETFPRAEPRDKPTWIGDLENTDGQLVNIIGEMYAAFSNGLYILTAQGLRTALDRATEVLGIDPTLTFAEKLDALKAGGWIGETERDVLGVVTDAGNAAAHRGWSPDAWELRPLLSALELFLQRAFIVGKKPLELKSAIPPKKARRKS